ncbi:major facilitator superfamily-domain-containing protein [Cantharellus anzutake]|uniref:major facilitator superfamily-domain-containing protein n=1 Tax=Cantharellus anzutake TaxID=1750568 RepID=UPI0019078150|nr:major facilitator superfamily-domain-containing protein [Cantharellus anzutake]KAF8309697.1 major facilitator superfamily-domain-containing protein [Cantharellus anzutake]
MDESSRLLPRTPVVEDCNVPATRRKPLVAYLVPFVIILSISRGITIGSRVQVYMDIACKESVNKYDSNTDLHSTPYALDHFAFSLRRSATPPGHEVYLPNIQLPTTSTSSFSPSKDCVASPAVQASAAELQALALTLNGALSAVTTGFWGTSGDKYGRTRVMTFLILGLMFWDLMFSVVCSPQFATSPRAARILVVFGAIVEGLMGSWATFFATMNAYISDCSEPGARAGLFSSYGGLYYGGIAIGPAIGSAFLRISDSPELSNNFYLALFSNLIVLIYVTFALPESLDPEEKERLRIGREARKKKESAQWMTELSQYPRDHSYYYLRLRRSLRKVFRFLAPLSVLAPRVSPEYGGSDESGIPRRKPFWRWDWDLTLIGIALWCAYLSMGIFPNKYLYAEHVYNWTPEELGYYIMSVAAVRAFWLVIALPALIQAFKPRLPKPISEVATGHTTTTTTTTTSVNEVTAARRRTYLLPIIRFDLRLAQLSVLCDTIAFTLTGITSSQTAFIITTGLSSLGGGMPPASQSLALALAVVDGRGRETKVVFSAARDGDAPTDAGSSNENASVSFDDEEDEAEAEAANVENVGVGEVFGAISVLQAVGQTIIGPLLMGEVYACTVGFFPRMMFLTGAGLLLVAFISLCLVNPAVKIPPQQSLERRNES